MKGFFKGIPWLEALKVVIARNSPENPLLQRNFELYSYK